MSVAGVKSILERHLGRSVPESVARKIYEQYVQEKTMDSGEVRDYIARQLYGKTFGQLDDEVKSKLDDAVVEITQKYRHVGIGLREAGELDKEFIEKEIEDEIGDIEDLDDDELRRLLMRLLWAYSVYDDDVFTDDYEFELLDGWRVPGSVIPRWVGAYRGLGGRRVFRRIIDKLIAGEPLSDQESYLLEILLELARRSGEVEHEAGAITTGAGVGYMNETYGDKVERLQPRRKEDEEVGKVASWDKNKFVDMAKKILERCVETSSQRSKIPAIVEWIWVNYVETRSVDGNKVISHIADALDIPVDEAGKAFKEIRQMIEDLRGSDEGANKGLSAIAKRLRDVVKELEEILKPEDKRPPKEWLDRKVKELMENQGLDRESATRLAAWIYWHWMKPTKPSSKKESDKPDTREARERKRRWLRSVND